MEVMLQESWIGLSKYHGSFGYPAAKRWFVAEDAACSCPKYQFSTTEKHLHTLIVLA